MTKFHKTEHPVFMLRGDVSILTDRGVERVKGPCMMVSPAGVKRVVYTHEDTVWINVHANPEDTTDLEEIEKGIIASGYDELALTEAELLALKEG